MEGRRVPRQADRLGDLVTRETPTRTDDDVVDPPASRLGERSDGIEVGSDVSGHLRSDI